MYYTGIDLHRKTSFFTTINESGQVVAKANRANDDNRIMTYLDALDAETKIVVASPADWYWLYGLLTDNGFDVVISNPLKTKSIASARIKTINWIPACSPSSCGRIWWPACMLGADRRASSRNCCATAANWCMIACA